LTSLFASASDKKLTSFPWQGAWSKKLVMPAFEPGKLFVSVTDFHIFIRGGGWINIWGGAAAACFGRGLVATPGKAKEKV
jgi:hypothetical protein